MSLKDIPTLCLTPKRRGKDLQGLVFGLVEVLSYDHMGDNHRPYWLCRCFCGTIWVTLGHHLQGGSVRSCGCASFDTAKINISGNVYGRLTALYYWDEPGNGSHRWLFLCECGNTTVAYKTGVVSGNTTSCGCYSSEVHSAIARARVGPLSPSWRGGKLKISQIVRKLDEYSAWRQDVYNRDLFKCQDCGSSKNLHAHHIVHFSVLLSQYNIESKEDAQSCPALWDTDNGVTVCKDCHLARHNGNWASNRSYNVKEVS